MGKVKTYLARIGIPVLLAVGIIAVLYNAVKKDYDEDREKIRGLEKALNVAGISRTNDSGVTTDNVIFRGEEHSGLRDINGDGIDDYYIFLKEKDGTYSERVVLGVK